MNVKRKMKSQRLWSVALALLGFSACDDKHDDDIGMVMYGTIPVHFIHSVVTDVDKKPIEGVRTVLEYKGMDGELARDTAYTDGNGSTMQRFGKGMDDLESAKAKLTFDDVDGEKNGAYESQVVEFSVKEVYIEGKVVHVELKEKKADE